MLVPKILQWPADIVFQLVVLPVTITMHVLLFAVALSYYIQMRFNGKLINRGVSFTAQAVCLTRYFAYLTGFGADWVAGTFAASFPYAIVHRTEVWLTTLRFNVTGIIRVPRLPFQFIWRRVIFYLDNILPVLISRTKHFDNLISRAPETVQQVVIMGAGFDSRAYRLAWPRGVRRWFEVDAPHMLQHKQELLHQANIPTSNVTYVPVVFDRENWLTVLKEHGFDPSVPSLFIMEGVLNYLDEETGSQTLKAISSLGKGTVLGLTSMMTAEAALTKKEQEHAAVLKRVGEPHLFRLKAGEQEEFFRRHNFTIRSFFNLKKMMAEYVPKDIASQLDVSVMGSDYAIFTLDAF